MDAVDDVSAVIIETTADRVRIGYAGESAPMYTASLLGGAVAGANSVDAVERAWQQGIATMFSTKDQSSAAELSQEANAGIPLANGATLAERTPLLLVEPARPWNASTRQKLVSFAFQTLRVPAVYVLRSAVATTFAWARTTALVLHLDVDGAVAAPVVDGYLLLRCMRQDPLLGLHWPDRNTLNDEEMKKPLKQVEAILFPCLTRLVFDAIMAVDVDMRRELFYNVLVTGDALCYLEESALVMRLHESLAEVCPHVFRSRVVNTSSEKLVHPGVSAAWIGASLCGTLGVFHQLWISRAEWEASPTSILEKRCP
ncbi:Actin-like 6A [Cyanidiococcus yangmingshanensis]|uniref:Actin-like 6A n=1 Tax=Cyanidiococcus yangmingshanensis TaxID=2690220 RepID=A0A7J7IMP4_9RHOD|nr:Actin-like 6A [Cyanidiococcus yangmingshanensis]